MDRKSLIYDIWSSQSSRLAYPKPRRKNLYWCCVKAICDRCDFQKIHTKICFRLGKKFLQRSSRSNIVKIAYLITSYNNPLHLQRLVNTISSPNSSCFIHIDKKADIKKFIGLEADNVHVSKKRYRVYWGGFSFIRAILLLIQQALDSPINFDRFV